MLLTVGVRPLISKFTAAAFMDVSKAFDCVNHDILLSKFNMHADDMELHCSNSDLFSAQCGLQDDLDSMYF